jgi:Fe-S cluster assembly protein SufD
MDNGTVMDNGAGGTFLQSALSLPCPPGWGAARQRAEEAARTSPLPSANFEDWKYLDLSAVFSHAFNPAEISASPPRASLGRIAPETSRSRLCFFNGQLDPHLSNTSALDDGIYFLPLAKAALYIANAVPNIANAASGMARCLGALAEPASSDLFANINTARFVDGALIYIPRGQSPDAPLHVVFRSIGETGRSPILLPRILVVLEPGARAHLIEEYCGGGQYLTSAVAEIILGEGSKLRHERIQRESMDAFHFSALRADIAKSALYTSTHISLGAAISRHSPTIAFSGEHGELELNGLSVANGSQAADTHSLVVHAVPSCSSRQLQKYVVGGAGHGIFNGQVLVRPNAQQTNASQSSRNLLLSERARIDAKPQLEIFADDVKCSHGATVGQLDAEELFYLQSRGLNMEAARGLLLAGFAADVTNRLALPSLRQDMINCSIRKDLS